jgi:hypothetical protein
LPCPPGPLGVAGADGHPAQRPGGIKGMESDYSHACQERASELDRIAAQLQPILEKHGVLRAVVFGSLRAIPTDFLT